MRRHGLDGPDQETKFGKGQGQNEVPSAVQEHNELKRRGAEEKPQSQK